MWDVDGPDGVVRGELDARVRRCCAVWCEYNTKDFERNYIRSPYGVRVDDGSRERRPPHSAINQSKDLFRLLQVRWADPLLARWTVIRYRVCRMANCTSLVMTFLQGVVCLAYAQHRHRRMPYAVCVSGNWYGFRYRCVA